MNPVHVMDMVKIEKISVIGGVMSICDLVWSYHCRITLTFVSSKDMTFCDDHEKISRLIIEKKTKRM